MIIQERLRQVDSEGWSLEHDDNQNADGELSQAATCYATVASSIVRGATASDFDAAMIFEMGWPWTIGWWKPSDDNIKNLVKAGALIVAEIERIQRAKDKV